MSSCRSAGRQGQRRPAGAEPRHGKSLNVNATHMGVRCVEMSWHASRHVI